MKRKSLSQSAVVMSFLVCSEVFFFRPPRLPPTCFLFACFVSWPVLARDTQLPKTPRSLVATLLLTLALSLSTLLLIPSTSLSPTRRAFLDSTGHTLLILPRPEGSLGPFPQVFRDPFLLVRLRSLWVSLASERVRDEHLSSADLESVNLSVSLDEGDVEIGEVFGGESVECQKAEEGEDSSEDEVKEDPAERGASNRKGGWGCPRGSLSDEEEKRKIGE